MSGLRLGLRNIRRVASGVAAPSNTAVPKFVDGQGNAVTSPVVGQQLFIDVGSWSNSPTYYTWQVYDDLGAILDASGVASVTSEDYYIVYDTEVGHPLHLSVVASNGLASDAALSVATSNVVDRSIAKPTLTRTSASGVTPMTWSLLLPSGAWAGDEVHLQVCTNSGFADADITQDVYHTLTEADLITPFTPDWSDAAPAGLTDPTATQYLRAYVIGITPQGREIVSPVSDSITPTDAVTAVTLNPSDKTAGVTLSNGNLTGDSFTSNVESVRATRGGTGKFYFEMHVDAIGATQAIAISDLTETLSGWLGDEGHAASTLSESSAFGGAPSTTFTTGDVMAFAVDVPNHKAWVLKNGTAVSGNPAAGTGGIDITALGSTVYPAWSGQNGHQIATFNFGATAFAYTPPTGFTAIP